MKKNIKTLNCEREFDVSELFFSTTDEKGIITACNEVFVRVAEYQPEEILGKPHNIVRHPQMPRCVFSLLWTYLLNGKSIGAYVKNRSNSGAYYWVFALAMPIDGGFISIRLKPTSPILDTVKSVYEQLLAHEESFGDDWRAGMQASTEMLLTQLKGLSFNSYDEFMAEALRTELSSRYKHIDARKQESITGLRSAFSDLSGLQDLKATLSSKNQTFKEFGASLSRNAMNLGIQAAHLAESGRGLGVICDEVSRISKLVIEESNRMVSENAHLTREIETSCFSISFASLVVEMLASFSEEQKKIKMSEDEQRAHFGKSFAELNKLLESCMMKSLKSAGESRSQLTNVLSSFETFVEVLGKILLSIQFSYVTGKSLAAAITGSEKFSMLLSEIVSFSDQARADTKSISEQVSNLNERVGSWGQHLQ